MGAGYCAAHLACLAPSLEDIDSINFALGLRDFNPAEHQPHPPGYPIYIAAGRVLLAAVQAVRPGLERTSAEALALSLLSVIAGSLALVLAWRVFGLLASAAGNLADARRVTLWATILLACCPLFWLTGVRPMSDMPGLAMAFASQALLLSNRLYAGAFVAGLGLGIRSQTLWVTAPLLAFLLLRSRGDRTWRDGTIAVLLAGAGALCWALPLLVLTGGIGAYLAALGSQAGEDFAFVDMLWADPTPRRLAFGLFHTLVLPWASTILAAVMMALGISGGLVLLVRDRGALGLILVAFLPYAAFHLVFQETLTSRYALPVVVPIVLLASQALAVAGRAMNLLAAPIAVTSLIVGVPAAFAYGSDPHPAFRAIADAARRAEPGEPAMVTSHFELRRALRAAAPPELPVSYAPLQREWMELVSYWASGRTETVWFLANPRRTDLDLIDPHSRRDVVRYIWRVAARPELSGARPANVDWYRLRPPGWFLGEGWSLTAETGGLVAANGTGPDRQPIVAHLRPQASPAHLLIGGRHLGGAAMPPAVFEMRLNGSVIDRWTVTADEGSFVRFLDLRGGVPASDSRYARLTVRSAPAEGDQVVPVAVRQFDMQPTTRAIFGFGAGWHEDEYDMQTGLRWRWTSDRAVLRFRAPAGPLRVRMRGESPVKYFDAAPIVTLAAGGRRIARLQPSADWEWDVIVPAEVAASSNGELTLETTHTFVPAETEGSRDTRRLGLRVFAIAVETAR